MASPRADVAAVCSRNPAKAAQSAAALGPAVRPFASVEAMVDSGAVDALYVNTPAETHYGFCLAAIRAGCAVICEKPLTTNTGAARQLRQAATAAGVSHVVNFTYRSMPGYRLTERLLCQHGIGRPVHAEFALLQGHDFLPDYPARSALLESGVHLYDTLLGLTQAAGFGTISEVCAAPMPGAGGLDHGWGFTLRMTTGAIVSAAFSRRSLGWNNGLRWSLYGDEAALAVELDSDRTEARAARRGDERPQGVWQPVAVPADLQADDARFPAYHMDRLVAAARGEAPFPGFAEAIAAHRLAAALAESAAAGRWVEVAA